jgi:hypothetical protein
VLRSGGRLGAVERGDGMLGVVDCAGRLGAVERGVGSVGDDAPFGGGNDGRVMRGDGSVGEEFETGA